MIAEQADPRLLDHQVEAFARVRAVADDVAQAENLFHALPAHVGQHRLERFQVAVNIADYGPFQFTARFGASSIWSSGGGIGRPNFCRIIRNPLV